MSKSSPPCREQLLPRLLLDLKRAVVDSDDRGAGQGVEAFHWTGDTTKEKIRGTGRTLRWMVFAMAEDFSGELVDLEQSRHPWYVTVTHPP
ncbi:hypothetical protein Bca52824_029767 [Brassica carinata]|uniref:Uncharacterized protein n=1 Tax=Brassica carinata TaxID=52824 RepID=A0A8X7V647_BRACI|nr:hypothetical protein Bca52824_029767 [Brassica carinata]